MGAADYYDHGNPNMICDRCGRKFKRSMLKKTWDNLYVCDKDWEQRQPQDKLKSIPDRQTFSDPRPEGTSNITYWDGSALDTDQVSPSTDDFLDTNEIQSGDL